MDNKVYCVWLSRALGAASHIYRKLMIHFGDDPMRVYKETLFDGLDLKQGTVEKLLDKDLSEAIEICGSCERSGIKIAVLGDGLYPKQLESIPNRPYVLYMKGVQCDLSGRPCVAIVGTRNATPYGRKTTRTLARELAGCSAVIVSGLAYGIDSEAHRGCLEANGYTVAVLGCGHERARRWDNGELLERIARSGMIISEYPPQMPAAKYTFPQRNRLISGLSRAVVVAQAGAKSGALITADYAVKQGRRLYAMAGMPGDGDYAGCEALLKCGAKLVTCAEDVLSSLGAQGYSISNPELERIKAEHAAAAPAAEKKVRSAEAPAEPVSKDSDSTEEKVYCTVKAHPEITADEICARLGMGAGEISEALTILEIEGRILPLPGQRFRII